MRENRSGKLTKEFPWPCYKYFVAVNNTTMIQRVIRFIRGIEHFSRDTGSGFTNSDESTAYYWHFNRLYWGRLSIFVVSPLSSANESGICLQPILNHVSISPMNFTNHATHTRSIRIHLYSSFDVSILVGKLCWFIRRILSFGVSKSIYLVVTF